MNQELIDMARQAGFARYMTDGEINWKMFETFAALVAAAEREACAKVCDGKVNAEYATGKVDHNEMGWTQACAIEIRARGEKK